MFRSVAFSLLFLFIVHISAFSQEPTTLIDSLAQVSSAEEKSKISIDIAFQLENSDWERARYYLDVAEENAKKANSEKILADFNIGAGDIYGNKDALDIALDYYLKAYDFYRDEETSKTKNDLEHKLAVVYGRIEEDEKAREFFLKVYGEAVKGNDSILRAKILNNIGTTYLHTNLDSSKYYYKTSLSILKNIPNEFSLKAYLHANLGRNYFQQDSLGEAQYYFQQAVKDIEQNEVERDRSRAWVYNTVAHYFFNIQNLDSAIVYAQKANLELQKSPFTFENQDALQTLYKAHLGRTDYKEAVEYFEKYDAVRDSLNIEQKSANVEKIKAEEAFKNRERIRELEESKERFRVYFIILALLAFLLLLAILLVRNRNKLKNTKLEKQLVEAKQKELNASLQLKNKELIGKAMTEMHRTEIMEEILQDLKEIKRKAIKKETQQAIDYIVKRLKRDTNSNIWEEFELRFEQVHESFYKNLIEKHPGLTSKDKRLCALLKLNLTTKEIAQITGQSLKSVENARTRLRKKLDLTHSHTDLSAYLFHFD